MKVKNMKNGMNGITTHCSCSAKVTSSTLGTNFNFLDTSHMVGEAMMMAEEMREELTMTIWRKLIKGSSERDTETQTLNKE